MYDVINNLYHLIVSLQMETGIVLDRSNNISVSIGLQNVMDRYGTDQKAIRYNGNIKMFWSEKQIKIKTQWKQILHLRSLLLLCIFG